MNDVLKPLLENELLTDEAKEEINRLKRQLEIIGSIDPAVSQEYEEIKTRYDFLTSQSQDLIASSESLQKITRDLDKTIREKWVYESNY